MSKKIKEKSSPKEKLPVISSLLDHMKDGNEFESLMKYQIVDVNPLREIRKSLQEIHAIRLRPAICYMANVVNTQIKMSKSIDNSDDLPFSEMITAVPETEQNVDVILVTPGGSAEQVAKFVDKLRSRFETVDFILPYMAMSAGTIFAMSGNNIIMSKNSYIGPIDPQVPNKDGIYVPAQAILTLIEDIRQKGEKHMKQGGRPPWTDLQILRQLDGKDIGNALNASGYSTELVEGYLNNFKFKDWLKHSDGRSVTEDERLAKAKEIAEKLCLHSLWKTHSRGITREVAWDVCKLKIVHSESIENLDRAIRRFWALMYWLFENSSLYKMFVSDNYAIFRSDSGSTK